jgi:hypothetical protein
MWLEEGMAECRPTGWRSVAASALHRLLSKSSDLAREAVNCNAVLGAYVWFKAV